ncbi:hypothetical protein [Caulobacter sp. 17J80-11]|uniref:hypothetical protein n=1 Tax=Caulobacter sp. 17J80-11 TaxID=2763502 RepID=UPI001653E882|nr:hypothetical protein [Caulobacter sp. 17J80-11]MBC6980439.1 hypothetical protein [Caulobacter sp. 17J80-11]
MRRLLLVLAASLIGAPALAQPNPRDAALRAGADFAQYRAQAEQQAAYAAQHQAETTLALRKLQQERVSPPGVNPDADAALVQDRQVVQDAGQRADAARLRQQETAAKIREIDAWLNTPQR